MFFHHLQPRQTGAGGSGTTTGDQPTGVDSPPTSVPGDPAQPTPSIVSTPPTDSSAPPSPQSQPPPPSSASGDSSSPSITPSSRSVDPLPSSSLPESTSDTSTSIPTTTSSSTALLPVSTSATPTTSSDTSTSSFTVIVTTLSDGSVLTSTAPLPTSLQTTNPSHAKNKVGIIAGATTAGIIFILILLGFIFWYRRNRLRKLLGGIGLGYGGRGKERKGLLEDEDFDVDDGGTGFNGKLMVEQKDGEGHSRVSSATSSRFGPLVVPTSSSSPYLHTATTTTTSRPTTPASSAPSLFRVRASESGSIFREEGVWPPPTEASEFVDPFVGHVRKLSGEVGDELGKVVDDVMGPGSGSLPNTGSSSGSGSGNTLGVVATSASNRPHSRDSAASTMRGSSTETPTPKGILIRSSPPTTLGPTPGTGRHDRSGGGGNDLISTSSRTNPTPGTSSSITPGPQVSNLPSASPPPSYIFPKEPDNTIPIIGTTSGGSDSRISEFGVVSSGGAKLGNGGLPPGAARSVIPGSRTKSSYSSDLSSSDGMSESMYSQSSAPYSMEYGHYTNEPDHMSGSSPPRLDLGSVGSEFGVGRGLGEKKKVVLVSGTQPKKSSPLARALSNDVKIFF